MNILFLSSVVPVPPLDGDRQRSFHLLRFLAKHHRVHWLGFTRSAEDEANLAALKSLCAMVRGVKISTGQIRWNSLKAWPGPLPLNVAAFQSHKMLHHVQELCRSHAIGAVHAYRLRMAPYALAAPVKHRVLDYTDALTRYFEMSLRQAAPGLKKMYLQREWQRLREYEPAISRRFDASVISGPKDRDVLMELGAAGTLSVVTNGVAMEDWKTVSPLPKTQRVVFLGNLDYPANRAGLADFCRTSWPKIKLQEPGASLAVIGKPPAGTGPALGAEFPGAELLGIVRDLKPELARARVAVCPVHVASGRQFKVLEYLAAGVPAVVTPVVAENLGARPEKHLLTAGDPELFGRQVVRLLRDKKLAGRLRREGRSWVEKQYAWDQAVRPLADIYQQFEQPARARKEAA